jgi:hypothetical protein
MGFTTLASGELKVLHPKFRYCRLSLDESWFKHSRFDNQGTPGDCF